MRGFFGRFKSVRALFTRKKKKNTIDPIRPGSTKSFDPIRAFGWINAEGGDVITTRARAIVRAIGCLHARCDRGGGATDGGAECAGAWAECADRFDGLQSLERD